MPCPDKIELICRDLGEDIDSPLCQELRKHLADCPGCRAYVDTLKKTVYLYRQLPREQAPEQAIEKLHRIIDLK